MRTALGVYIFAGGFTLGVKRAGFEVLAQLEDGPYGVATTRRNHPGLAVHTDPATWPLAEFAGKVDFIYGNPPCAPFSNAGVSAKKVGQMNDWWRGDPRASCITRMFSVLEAVRPAVWAWESVQPALRRGREMIDELTYTARAHGYAATYVLMNAAHLGVPQVRRRFFCVFHRIAIDWQYPTPGTMPLRTVRDAWAPILTDGVADPEFYGSALGHDWALTQVLLPQLRPVKTDIDILERTPQGGSLRKLWEKENPPETFVRTKKGDVKGRPGFVRRRLSWDKPAPTLLGGQTVYHPDQPRFVTLLEHQLLCGYPADYAFEGSKRLAQTAQAVMPPVGEWLARNVMRALEANKPVDPTSVTIENLEIGDRIDARRPESLLAQPVDDFRVVDMDVPPEESARRAARRTNDTLRITDAVDLTEEPIRQLILAEIDAATRRAKGIAKHVEFLPAQPSQESVLPLWETYNGPTALAQVLIEEGHNDGAILAATAAAIRGAKSAGAKWPVFFTRRDLGKLRARTPKERIGSP